MKNWIVLVGCVVAAIGASLGYVAEHSVLTAGFAVALWVCVGVLVFRATRLGRHSAGQRERKVR